MKSETQITEEAEKLDQIGIKMYQETDDIYRRAEISNIRMMLSCILSGFLEEGDDKIIDEVRMRLDYLQKHKESSGRHSISANPINGGNIVKR